MQSDDGGLLWELMGEHEGRKSNRFEFETRIVKRYFSVGAVLLYFTSRTQSLGFKILCYHQLAKGHE